MSVLLPLFVCWTHSLMNGWWPKYLNNFILVIPPPTFFYWLNIKLWFPLYSIQFNSTVFIWQLFFFNGTNAQRGANSCWQLGEKRTKRRRDVPVSISGIDHVSDLLPWRCKNEAVIEVGGQGRPAVEPGVPAESPEVGLRGGEAAGDVWASSVIKVE